MAKSSKMAKNSKIAKSSIAKKIEWQKIEKQKKNAELKKPQKKQVPEQKKQGGMKTQEGIKIAIMWFPGTNCEEETARAVAAAGMLADIVRWNSDYNKLREYDGYILPGGWSYEDRIRAGAIASRDPVMDIIKSESDNGKPVLGICNGAQILIEKGMVPATKPDIEMALAPNENQLVSGYYCTWTYVKAEGTKNAFASAFKQGEAIAIPIAHGEGRFLTADSELREKLRKDNMIVFKYCDEDGRVIEKFPTNPNGSIGNIAAICNAKGNVMAIMPHPERASWQKQLPGFSGTLKEAENAAPARKIFESMKSYIEKMRRETKEKVLFEAKSAEAAAKLKVQNLMPSQKAKPKG